MVTASEVATTMVDGKQGPHEPALEKLVRKILAQGAVLELKGEDWSKCHVCFCGQSNSSYNDCALHRGIRANRSVNLCDACARRMGLIW